jgi:ABC-type maltose transport system permease subunit
VLAPNIEAKQSSTDVALDNVFDLRAWLGHGVGSYMFPADETSIAYLYKVVNSMNTATITLIMIFISAATIAYVWARLLEEDAE